MTSLNPRPVAESRSELAELVMPHLANGNGTLHGGELLSRIDKAAAVCAMRHAGAICVTAAVDEVSFHEPIRIGELIRLVAWVNYVGRSSMEIEVEVTAEDLVSRFTRHTNSCLVTMVAVDEELKPRPVPPLEILSEEDRKRSEAGARRAEARRARRQP